MTRTWPPYQTLEPLVHKHVGRTAVVIGGGASMRFSLPKCPTDAIYISVNDHGARYLKDTALFRTVSYMVACDKIEERARADIGFAGLVGPKRDGKPWNLTVISRHPWADYRLTFLPGTCSGMAAAWFARFLGCAPVILVGMDLYRNGKAYVDAPKAKSTGFHITDLEHLSRWGMMTRRYPYQYVSIDCHPDLEKRIGVYDAGLARVDPVPREQLVAELQIVRIRLTRDTLVDMRPFPAGTVLPVSRTEAENLCKKRGAVLA